MHVPQMATMEAKLETNNWEGSISADFQQTQNAAETSGKPQQSRQTSNEMLENLVKEADDPSCIFIARNINQLGLHSQKMLREHFSQYGEVLRVNVAHRKSKGLQDNRGQPKTRPGNSGLITMKRPGSVRKIMAVGKDHIVSGQKIRIEMFEPSKLPDAFSTDESTMAGDNFSLDASGKSHSISEVSPSSDSGGGGVDAWSRESSIKNTIPETEVFTPTPGLPLF